MFVAGARWQGACVTFFPANSLQSHTIREIKNYLLGAGLHTSGRRGHTPSASTVHRVAEKSGCLVRMAALGLASLQALIAIPAASLTFSSRADHVIIKLVQLDRCDVSSLFHKSRF